MMSDQGVASGMGGGEPVTKQEAVIQDLYE